MADYDFDLFVIGAGSGGVRAARIAAGHGAKVAIAEEHRVGGTCVIRGCVPKKMLVYGAMFAEELGHAGAYGWTIGDATFDWARLRDHVNNDVDRLEGLYQQGLDNVGCTLFAERATITGPNGVKLASGREISAKFILVATGGWPSKPEFAGNDLCITSNEVFHLPELPQTIVIQGGGYIALEFAGIFNALGSEVILVNRTSTILRGYEEAVVDRLLSIASSRGIVFAMNSQIRSVSASDSGYVVDLGRARPVETDQVLIATGRRANTDGLGLENAGIAPADNGTIPVNEYSQTSCDSIYAVGDVTGRVELTPVAIREGHAFADTVFGGNPRTVDYSSVPSAVFSQPPIASVGLTEGQARNAYGEVKVFSSDFRPMKNVFAETAERGLYKMVVDADTDRVLGLHMIGPDSPEILQAAAIAIKAGLTKAQFDDTIALHPSMAEELVLMR